MSKSNNNAIANILNKNVRTIKRNFKVLIDNNIIERIGSDKTGYWNIKKGEGNMKIYVMRHGATRMNKYDLYNGLINEDLIEEGIESAKKVSNDVKILKLDRIYCSPLLRAKHTCDIVNVNKVPVVFDDRLKERTMGILDGKKIEESGITDDKFYDYNYKTDIEGFEDLPHLFKRVHSFLDEVIKKEQKNILIIAHGGTLRAIYFYFNKIPNDGNLLKAKKSSKNCQIDFYEI